MEDLAIRIPERYAQSMTLQIAIRIPDDQLRELDDAIKRGQFKNRADGVRRALGDLLAELREGEIAREYREAYTQQPQDPEIGLAGAKLLADFYEREESQSR
jgi:Arc/MetJ-type ribon-helix-helix transcriptional regulator